MADLFAPELPPPADPGPTDSSPEPDRLREVALMAAAQRLSGLGEIRDADRAPRVIADAEVYLAWLKGEAPDAASE